MTQRPRTVSHRWLAIMLAWSLAGCGKAPADIDDVPARYGLAQTVRGRALAEQAILLIDFLLPQSERLRLRLTWPQSGLYPQLKFESDGHARFSARTVQGQDLDDALILRNAEAIPVFLIGGDTLGRNETAFVPDGERCIFINVDTLDALIETFAMTGPMAAQQHPTFDKSLVLAVVLLHEMGHLHYGDQGSYDTLGAFDPADVARPSATIHEPELRADRFASEAIEQGWASHEMHAAIDGPYGRAIIANNLARAVAVASNSFDYHQDPQGLLSRVSRPQLFRQGGLSHLNLQLRLLLILQQIYPDLGRQQELAWIASELGPVKSNRHPFEDPNISRQETICHRCHLLQEGN